MSGTKEESKKKTVRIVSANKMVTVDELDKIKAFVLDLISSRYKFL